MKNVTVEILGKPACTACFAATRYLKRHGIPYAYADVTTDPEARQRAEATGLLQLPIIFIGDQAPVSGFRIDVLERLRKPAAGTNLAAA